MFEGVWIVQFHGPRGYGGGVVVLANGKVYGGDSGFIWTGSYSEKAGVLTANAKVKHFDTAIPSVMGIAGDFDLVIEGTLKGEVIAGTASLARMPGARMSVRLTKHSNL